MPGGVLPVGRIDGREGGGPLAELAGLLVPVVHLPPADLGLGNARQRIDDPAAEHYRRFTRLSDRDLVGKIRVHRVVLPGLDVSVGGLGHAPPWIVFVLPCGRVVSFLDLDQQVIRAPAVVNP